MYKNILLAVDLHPAYDEHTTKVAVGIAKDTNANLHVIHCVEPIHAYGATQGYQLILEVEQQAEQEAAKALAELGEKHNIPENRRIVIVGPPEQTVLEQAKKMQCDLIIVGEHGRHGISILFGTTSDGIIHHAHCDVLAVRTPALPK